MHCGQRVTMVGSSYEEQRYRRLDKPVGYPPCTQELPVNGYDGDRRQSTRSRHHSPFNAGPEILDN